MERKAGYGGGDEDRTARETRFDPTDDSQILAVDPASVLNGIFGAASPVAVEASIGFARFMNRVGINISNYPIFLRLLQTNNRWIVDALIGNRQPQLLFTNIRPTTFLVAKAFQLLSFWHPGQIYHKVLRAVMGIIEYSYYDADDGYRIYRVRLADINSVGKFLDEGKDQFDEVNSLVLQVLDRITQMGTYEASTRKRTLAKHAFDIRLSYFDDSKRCIDVIPEVLLTRVDREANEVRPSKPYETFLKNSRSNE